MALADASPPVPENQLCPTCGKIDFKRGFNLHTGKQVFIRDAPPWKYELGYLRDIALRPQCPFCRLVVQALLARWPVKPWSVDNFISAKTTDRDEVKCYAIQTRAGTIEPGWRGLEYEAAQISISTNLELPPGFPFPVYSHGDIAIVGADAQRLGYEPTYHARSVSETSDLNRAREWLKTCEKNDRLICNHIGMEHIRVLPKSLRLVDVRKLCLVQAPAFPRYVALSYVWGQVDTLRATKDIYQELMKPGSLRSANMRLSPLIKDAIKVTSELKEQYLWVDQLCILQDDPQDKARQIGQMDLIYIQAVLTIIVAGGENIQARLPGLSEGLRDRAQKIEQIGDLRLVVPLPTLPSALGSSRWNTRAWTFQEYHLSRRRLVFTGEQMYFQCRRDTMAEDVECEPKSGFSLLPSEERVHRVQSMSQEISFNQWQWPHTYIDYAMAVELYTARQLTFPEDILLAFIGTQNVLQRLTRWKFWQGLPEDILDHALLWRPKGDVRRRRLGQVPMKLTSASWAAWNGAVHITRGHMDLISHIPTFEARSGSKRRTLKRRMIPASEPAQLYAKADVPASLVYDMSTERLAVLSEMPDFSSMLRKSKRLLGGSSSDMGLETMGSAETLHFETDAATFSVAKSAITDDDTRHERVTERNQNVMASPFDEISAIDRGRRCWIYDGRDPARRVGFVWKVSEMEEEGFDAAAAHFILLSRWSHPSGAQAAEAWKFDASVGKCGEGCMLNVMLVRSLDDPSGEILQRVTIGEIHTDAWKLAGPVRKDVALQ